VKTLLLLRHAKSSWEDASLSDFERPLNKRGSRAAPRIGQFMRERQLRPDLVLCSPAQRARDTASLALEAGGIETLLRYEARIYEADVPTLLEIIRGIEEAHSEVMLVGHNPGLEELLGFLTGENRHMRTATLARIVLNSEKWSDAGERDSGRLELFVKARELTEANMMNSTDVQ
jgi:phosphohistidine phosphatase